MTELNLIGTNLGRFEILSELGRGGMAVVYRARQTDLDRIVALKVLPPALTHDASYVARFRQEARSAARLEHPHIMPIYEVGEAEGKHYIAMKFIDGQTVKDLVQAEGALSVQRAATILAQVGDALDYAHRQGVIHRDIKPSNMMVTDEGWVYLTDFGLARGSSGATAGLTMAGTVMGTPEYMSPEQAQGLPNVGPPTDIYALGVVLYELLTGTFPFTADTPMGMLAARLLQAPTPPRDVRGDLPSPVEDVIMKALARKPEARFPTAAAMVTALRSAAGIGAVEPPRPATPVGGLPALGETMRIPGPPPVNQPPTPGSGQPYVQRPPLDLTQPAAALPPNPVPQPGPGVRPPTPGDFALPSPTPQPAAPAQRKGPNVLAVVLGAVGVVALACIGLVAVFALRGDPTGPPNVRTAVADGDLTVALAGADEPLAEQDGMAQAIANYDALLAEYPADPRVLGRLAMAYNAAGNWPRAEEYANQLIDAPASDSSQVALGYALLADAYASQGDLSAALGEIGKAIENDAALALGHAVESNLLAARARAAGDTAEMDVALASLDRAVDALPDEEPLVAALTQNALGYTFGQEHALSGSAEFFSQSEAAYLKASELLPASGLFHANRGYLLLADEDYDGARDAFKEALDAGYPTAHAGLGWVFYNENDTDKAEEAFDDAIAEAPEAPDGYFGKGRLRYNLDDYDGAIALFAQAVELNPRSAELQGWLGEAYWWKGFSNGGQSDDDNFAQAAEAYNKAIAADERNVFALSGLGWTLQYQEQYAESVAAFEQALAFDPHNAALYNGKGWSQFNNGDSADAEASFREALARDDTYAEAHYNLGRVLEDQGRIDEARAEYQRALELDPEYTAAQERLDGLGQ